MEERAIYAVNAPQAKALQLPREVLVSFDDPVFRFPSADEVRQTMRVCLSADGTKLTGSEIGLLLGVSSRTIRRWMSADPDDVKEIPYAAWRLLLIALGLVDPPRLQE